MSAIGLFAPAILKPNTKSGGVSLVGQHGRWEGAVRFGQGLQGAEEVTNLFEGPSVELLSDITQGIGYWAIEDDFKVG